MNIDDFFQNRKMRRIIKPEFTIILENHCLPEENHEKLIVTETENTLCRQRAAAGHRVFSVFRFFHDGSFPAPATALAISITFWLPSMEKQPEAIAQNQGEEEPVCNFHRMPPIWYTRNAAIQATMHWEMTTTMVLHLEPSSRRMVATAATQGV